MSNQPEDILAYVIARRAETDPDFEVLTIEGAGVRPDEVRTYRTLWDNARRMAKVMMDHGLQPGDRMALLMANHVELVEALVAASILGAAVVPIDPRARGDVLHYQLSRTQCNAVFAADYALDQVVALKPALPHVRWVMSFATDEGNRPLYDHPEVINWITAAPAAVPDLPILTTDADTALELIFTSGTTGRPKAIVMTNRRYCESSLLAPRLFSYLPDDTLYSGLSLTHANAQVVTLGAALVNRLRCVLSRRFSKSRLWEITRKYHATSFTLLGGMTTAVYAEPQRDNDADNPVRHVVSAGMPAALWTDFEQRFDVKVLEFYGAAEGGLTFHPPGAGPVGSIGQPAPNLQWRIVDEEGQDVPCGTAGELLFRHADGRPFVVEYFGDRDASATKCAGGWLHMGDVVHADANGWLFFHYRKGSGLRRNGEFISTASIEKVIAESGLVEDVYVYGITSANLAPGERDVVAAVVPKHTKPDIAQRLFALCRAQLDRQAVPQFIQILDQIPKTASEKPLDRYLVEAFEATPQHIYRVEPVARI